MASIERALEILDHDRIRNANIINFMKDYPIERMEIEGKSVLVKGRSDKDWRYISSESEPEFEKLTGRLIPEEKYFAVLEDWMVDSISRSKKLEWKMSCQRLYFPEEVRLPEVPINPIPLKPEHADYIYEKYGYKAYSDVKYIRERILMGPSLGIFQEGILVGWIMTHDDGAIGILQVLKDYRRLGYATALLLRMIDAVRNKGGIPFVQIEESNAASMNLSLKLGFRKDRNVSWIRLK